MGLKDWIMGDNDNSDERINSLIGSIHKLANLADSLIPAQQATINQIIQQHNQQSDRITKIENFLKEKMENE